MRISALLLAGVATTGLVAVQEARAGATVDDDQGQGLRPVRRERLRPARVRRGRFEQQLVGPRHRPVPGGGRGAAGRRDQGQVHAAQRQGAVHRAAVGRDRRALAQHDLEQLARQRARPRFPRRQLLRRPGLHGQEVARRRQCLEARRGRGLRPGRHHHRAQPRRLLPRQQHDVHPGRVREQRRGQQGLRGRPLRRADHRPVRPLRHPRQARRQSSTTT